MPPILSKAAFTGKATQLLTSSDRNTTLEKSACQKLELLFAGIKGDCHGGLTRMSDTRTRQQYKLHTEIRNVRQVTLVSQEELAAIAAAMGIATLAAAWLGANLVTSGIPHLTLLPPSSRLQFPSGATLVVDMENAPCRQVAEVVAKHHPEAAAGLVGAATHRRGLTAWVEREGAIHTSDEIIVWLPPQRLYPGTPA